MRLEEEEEEEEEEGGRRRRMRKHMKKNKNKNFSPPFVYFLPFSGYEEVFFGLLFTCFGQHVDNHHTQLSK